MTDYEKRTIHKIEMLTFQVTSEMAELLGKLKQSRFEECLAISINLHFLTQEIVRLNRKLTALQDE